MVGCHGGPWSKTSSGATTHQEDRLSAAVMRSLRTPPASAGYGPIGRSRCRSGPHVGPLICQLDPNNSGPGRSHLLGEPNVSRVQPATRTGPDSDTCPARANLVLSGLTLHLILRGPGAPARAPSRR